MDTQHIVCPHCDSVNRVPTQRAAREARCGSCHKALFTGAPLELDNQRFDRHIGRSDIPVMVDFWAPWCGPCKMMAPAFAEATAQLEPAMRLAKVNSDEAQQLAMRFGIRSIPTLVIFKQGREVDRVSGALDRASLLRFAQAHTSQ